MAKPPVKIAAAVGSAANDQPGMTPRAIEDVMAKAVTDAQAEGVTDPNVIRQRKLDARNQLKDSFRAAAAKPGS